jgi:hypothetical protein
MAAIHGRHLRGGIVNIELIKVATAKLEREVAFAIAQGYENADCVLTNEVRALLPLAKAGSIVAPVQLRFTAGPARNFSETRLGECKALQEAWSEFRAVVEDWESHPIFQMFKAGMKSSASI